MDRTADIEILGCHWQKRIVNILLRVPGMVFLLRWGSENYVAHLLASLQLFDLDMVCTASCFQEKKREIQTTRASGAIPQLPAVLLACFRSGSVSRSNLGPHPSLVQGAVTLNGKFPETGINH